MQAERTLMHALCLLQLGQPDPLLHVALEHTSVITLGQQYQHSINTAACTSVW